MSNLVIKLWYCEMSWKLGAQPKTMLQSGNAALMHVNNDIAMCQGQIINCRIWTGIKFIQKHQANVTLQWGLRSSWGEISSLDHFYGAIPTSRVPLLTRRSSFRCCSMFLFCRVNMAAATWLMAVARQWMLFLWPVKEAEKPSGKAEWKRYWGDVFFFRAFGKKDFNNQRLNSSQTRRS